MRPDETAFVPSQEILRLAIGDAVRAPSAHNAQPWSFGLGDQCVDVYMDRSRAQPVVDPDERELVMSCAAATFHLRASLAARGIETECELFPNEKYPTWIARVSVVGARTEPGELGELAEAIAQRRTNRGPFMGMPVPDDVVEIVREAAVLEGAWLLPFDAEHDRVEIIALVMDGDHQQWGDARFRDELAAWIRPAGSDARDGLPARALGAGAVPDSVARWVVRTVDLGTRMAKTDRDLVEASPMLAVLGTDGDTPEDWARAGMALDRVLLALTAEGLSASFMNQPVEVAPLRAQLHTLLRDRGRGGYAQAVLRIGFGPEAPATPRRAIEDVIMRPTT